MRAESERAFQGGGTVDEIIARTTDPTPGESLSQMLVRGATAPEDRTQLIIRSRDDALARLRAGQKGIAERRAKQQKQDERAKWMAFAQGMLSPTRTGGFGESIGTTAGLMGQEMELARQHEGERIEEEMLLAGQEQDIHDDYIDQLQTEARISAQGYSGEYSQRRPIGTAHLIPHPEDPTRDARVQTIWDPDHMVQDTDEEGNPLFDDNGEPLMRKGGTRYQYIDVPGPDGGIPFAITRLDANRQAEIEFQTGLAGAEAERVNNDIMGGRDAWPMIQKLEKAMGLLEQVRNEGRGTGGYVALLQNLAEWFGVDTSEVTTMGEIRNMLGQNVLNGLKHFPGQISEGERKYMESLETALAKPAGVNIALLEEGLRVERARHRKGVFAATELKLHRDLRAMGIDPDAPPGTAPAGSTAGARQQVPGATRQNPIDVVQGMPPPSAGTWIRLPNGVVRKYQGDPNAERSESAEEEDIVSVPRSTVVGG